jgi:dTMP kinase
LNLKPEKSFLRPQKKAYDRLETEGIDFHKRVYKGYKELISLEPSRFIVIDAGGDKEATHENVLGALREIGFIQ